MAGARAPHRIRGEAIPGFLHRVAGRTNGGVRPLPSRKFLHPPCDDLRQTYGDRPRSARARAKIARRRLKARSEEHTSELQSRGHLVCRLLLEKKKTTSIITVNYIQ